jgi:sensor domain DACNV-containing protein
MGTMKDPAYPAARIAAPRVHAHFARRLAKARERGLTSVASLPEVRAIEAMVDSAFWASLRREEGYVPRVSLAFVSPQETTHPLLFERPLALDPGALTRVAPAVERAGIHLGAWPRGDELIIWGTTQTIPAGGFVLEVAAPGLLVVKEHRRPAGKYVNIAVLEGDQVKMVGRHDEVDGPQLVASFLGLDSPTTKDDAVNVLVQLAVSMRAHRRGGVLLFVPPATQAWRESIVQPISYGLSPPFSELALLSLETPDDGRRRAWQDALERAVEAIAGLTAVDGATVLTTGYDLLAFGAKIARRKGGTPVERVTLTEAIEDGGAVLLDPTQLGGTRHLSAAQFAHDQRDAVALVASQDGRFTIFAWSPREGAVHAYRVEALLL